MPNRSFTGRSRKRVTKRTVRAADLAARALITVGGIGTIVTVCTVFVYLAWVVVPLFLPASITLANRVAFSQSDAALRHVAIDEFQSLGWALDQNGKLWSFQLDRDTRFEPLELQSTARISAATFPPIPNEVGLGYSDGTVRLGRIFFQSRYLEPSEIPAELKPADEASSGVAFTYQGGTVQRTPIGQYRWQKLAAELDEALDVDPDSDTPISRVDYVQPPSRGTWIAALSEDGKLRLLSVSVKKGLIGAGVRKVETTEVHYRQRNAGKPDWVFLNGQADSLHLLWKDGLLRRYDLRDRGQPVVAEELDLLEDPTAAVTAACQLASKTTLVVGDSKGRVRAWFRVNASEPTASDVGAPLGSGGMVCGHEFHPWGAAVTSFAASGETRVLAIGYADGQIRLLHVTSEKQIASIEAATSGPVETLALAPNDDGLVAASQTGLQHWRVDAPHPEVTLSSLLLPVWYEGYERPIHMWQADSVEPKLGLWPLIRGTLKGTLYSMLFGAPLALMAAIYTSEFLHPRVRAKVKPTIELMASLPSVVLGFIAGLLLAPFIERVVPAVLAGFVTIPLAFLSGAYLWQLLPYRTAIVLSKWRVLATAATLPIGLLGAVWLGPRLVDWLFAGDFMLWLSSQHGTGVGAWMMLTLPLCGCVTLILGREVNSFMRRHTQAWSRLACGLAELLKFLLGSVLLFGSAWGLSWLLNTFAWDPRGTFIGRYDQQNSLVVGFVMGFAIIPLIYTIAEDALSTVPEHLRSASLGAGATPWQTATRIVIPTAMSGLFSALMIGLGRAVGETMIVLMAAGATPVLDWNVFNGFRSLSANIATELAESVQDSTHYRTLFFAALCLFGMTFVVNTVAEVIRQRFRKRAYQL